MFTTIAGYFLFIIPATILLALGIIFEEKLVEVEELVWCKIKTFFRGHTMSPKNQEVTFSKPQKRVSRNNSTAMFELSA